MDLAPSIENEFFLIDPSNTPKSIDLKVEDLLISSTSISIPFSEIMFDAKLRCWMVGTAKIYFIA